MPGFARSFDAMMPATAVPCQLPDGIGSAELLREVEPRNHLVPGADPPRVRRDCSSPRIDHGDRHPGPVDPVPGSR